MPPSTARSRKPTEKAAAAAAAAPAKRQKEAAEPPPAPAPSRPADQKTDSAAASAISSAAVPAKAQIEAYERDGYLHVTGFYNEAEVGMLRAFLKEVEKAPDRVGSYMKYFETSSKGGVRILQRVEDFCRRHEGFAGLLARPETSGLVQFAQRLLGSDLVLFKDKVNFKLPGGDGFKAHQDQAAGWGNYISWFVSIGIFIDPSTKKNGCLEVSAGKHREGLLGKEWEPIEDLPLPYEAVECAPGDIIIFDSFVPHRSAPNTSDRARRAMFMTYSRKDEGDRLADYFRDKRRDFPPDIERPEGVEYVYRV